VPHPALIQLAELGGVYLLSFVVALVNGLVAEAGWRRTATPAIAAAAAIALTATYGAVRLRMPLPTEPEIPVLVVQGNVDLGSQWREELYGEGLQRYVELTREAAARVHPRLIVWPEAAVTFFPDTDAEWGTALTDFVRALGVDVVIGAPRTEGTPARYFNSAFWIDRDGRIAAHYDKVHLLPFAEYFPLRTIELLRRKFERVRSFTAADEPVLLHTGDADVATLICFEAIFPDVVRRQTAAGATLMMNLSNDGWFGPTAGAEQHLAMVAMRAVESRLWVVRATTTGVSAIIDPYGRIVARAPLFASTTIDARVVPMAVTTPYERFGDVVAWCCVALALVAIVRR
jgi:apolipoprotein N-acyltransferase